MTLALRTRLAVAYTAVFGVLLTALAAVSYSALAQQLDSDATSGLLALTTGLHGYLRINGGQPQFVFDPANPEESAFVLRATRYYQIYDGATGALLDQSDPIEPLGLTFTPAEVKAFQDQPKIHDIQTDYGRIRLTNSVIEQGGRSYLLQVGVSLAAMDAAVNGFLRLLLWLVPAGLIAAVGAGWWMARVALAPLTRLADAARTIDAANLRHRLPLRGTRDELDAVAMAFNDTLARVEDAVGEMRQFSTALAHELRTPIAALRGEIELAAMNPGLASDLRAAAASQLEELDKLKRLIDHLLTLARAESGQIPLHRAPVDLAALVETIVEQLEPVAQAQGLALTAELTAAPVVQGDAEWLERLLLNLLDNAFKFTPRGGTVVVRLSEAGEAARLEVRDTGIGMAADVLPHVFERFYRADPARSSTVGVGLGLSLVQWIAQQHHATVSVTSTPGDGSAFVVDIKKI